MKILFALWLAVGILPAAAQEPSPPTKPCAVDDVWMLQMQNPAREFAVRMSALQTVTLQDYDMRKDGKVQRVLEMTVETTGGNRARFFWEDTAEDLVKIPDEIEAKRREVEAAMKGLTGVERNDSKPARVQKDYPVTTHSGWAEFKLGTEGDVRHLHKELMQMWTGKKRDE